MDLTNYNDKLTSALKKLEEKYKNQRWFAREYLNRKINDWECTEFDPTRGEFPRTAIMQFIRYNENDWLEAEEDKYGKIIFYLCKECEIGTYGCFYHKEKSKYYVKILIVDSEEGTDWFTLNKYPFVNINEDTHILHFDYLSKSIKNANIGDRLLEVITSDKSGFIRTIRPTCFKDSSNNYVLRETRLSRVNDTNIEIFVSYSGKKSFSVVDKRDVQGRLLGETELIEFLNNNNIQCTFNNKDLKEKEKAASASIPNTIKTTTDNYSSPMIYPKKKSTLKFFILLVVIAYVVYKFVLK